MAWIDGLDIPFSYSNDVGFFEFGSDRVTDYSTPNCSRSERLWCHPGLRPLSGLQNTVSSPIGAYRRQHTDAPLTRQLLPEKKAIPPRWNRAMPRRDGGQQKTPAFRARNPQALVPAIEDGDFRLYMGHGTKIYLLPLLHRKEVSYDVTCLAADSAPAPQSSKDQLLKVVEGFDERLVRITEGLGMGKVNLRAVYDIDPVDKWHSDSVVLIGDAAHAMLHHQGQGANSAVLDAGALADCLATAASVPEALAAYQAMRKPVTDVLQRTSRQGWSEDEIKTVFPNQRPGEIAARS